MYPERYISDEQRRSLPEFARPQGSQKDFCVAPPQCSIPYTTSRRRALKSSHFLASKAGSGSHPAPYKGFKRTFFLLKYIYKSFRLWKKKFIGIVFLGTKRSKN
jgi:hypothetical protein